MVIHDLRNPTTQISFTSEEILKRYSIEKKQLIDYIKTQHKMFQSNLSDMETCYEEIISQKDKEIE